MLNPMMLARPVQISLRRLYEVFAEKLKRERFTNADIPLLSKGMQANYCEQRAAYYSALSIEHSVRDVFDDGENEFQKLKEDAWHGINTIYWRKYTDGYKRPNTVIEKITSTFLDGSVFSQIAVHCSEDAAGHGPGGYGPPSLSVSPLQSVCNCSSREGRSGSFDNAFWRCNALLPP